MKSVFFFLRQASRLKVNKRLFFLAACILILAGTGCKTTRVATVSCPNCDFCLGDDTPPGDPNGNGGVCDRAASAEASYRKYLLLRYTGLSEIDIDKLSPQAVEQLSHPIQIKYAQIYAREFSQRSKIVRLFMGKTYRNSFLFDSKTLGAFASLYCKGQIDGVRAYVAKYDKNKEDPGVSTQNHYTVILVGTKFGYDSAAKCYAYKDVYIPVKDARNKDVPNLYISVQDYSNPCKPTPCPGATLPTLDPAKPNAITKY